MINTKVQKNIKIQSSKKENVAPTKYNPNKLKIKQYESFGVFSSKKKNYYFQ